MKRFFILWNPDSSLPPQVRFDTHAEASEIAKQMALRHKQRFYVMEAKEFAEVHTPVTVTKLVK